MVPGCALNKIGVRGLDSITKGQKAQSMVLTSWKCPTLKAFAMDPVPNTNYIFSTIHPLDETGRLGRWDVQVVLAQSE